MGQSKNERMKELVSLLNKASRAYYQEAQEIMSNYEYDRLYDELKELEDELGITLSNSPTVNVGYEVVSELPKERHESPMLSLDKTKEVEELKNFVGDQKVLMSWKMDGLTVVLTYRDGKLYNADSLQCCHLIAKCLTHPADLSVKALRQNNGKCVFSILSHFTRPGHRIQVLLPVSDMYSATHFFYELRCDFFINCDLIFFLMGESCTHHAIDQITIIGHDQKSFRIFIQSSRIGHA